jgi:hypothetical protein
VAFLLPAATGTRLPVVQFGFENPEVVPTQVVVPVVGKFEEVQFNGTITPPETT